MGKPNATEPIQHYQATNDATPFFEECDGFFGGRLRMNSGLDELRDTAGEEELVEGFPQSGPGDRTDRRGEGSCPNDC